MTPYLCHSILWSAFWLGVGYVIGRIHNPRKKRHMATPEKSDRSQFLTGIGLVIVGLLVIVSTLYNQHRANEQRDCLTRQVQAITKAFTARGDLNQRGADATTNVILSVASAKSSADVRQALAQFVETQGRISSAKKDHPVPPFPNGSCDQ